MLDKIFSLVRVTRKLLLGKNATLAVTNSDGSETTVNIAELAALDNIAAADLAKIDGITNGTAAAAKALVLGATSNIDTFRMTGKLFTPQAAPETATDTATLTAAQMLSGILVATPTSAADYTMLTGALLSTAVVAIHPNLTAGDCFDLVIINLGGSGDDITLTAPASGITIVGDPVVGPVADVATEQMSTGTFRFRYTAANTFIAYRVA